MTESLALAIVSKPDQTWEGLLMFRNWDFHIKIENAS